MSALPKLSLSLLLHAETPGAVLVSLDDDHSTVWLPKAGIMIDPQRGVSGPNRNRKKALARLLITVPHKLAQEKGLLADPRAAGQGRLL